MTTTESRIDGYTSFFREAEPRLRRALVAALGIDAGREAAAEALAYGWEHWDRIEGMENPAGYLYRVGRSRARHRRKLRVVFPEEPSFNPPWVEPGLPKALERLTEKQRTALLLVHGYGWTTAEVGELLGISAGSAQQHAARGLQKARVEMEVEIDA